MIRIWGCSVIRNQILPTCSNIFIWSCERVYLMRQGHTIDQQIFGFKFMTAPHLNCGYGPVLIFCQASPFQANGNEPNGLLLGLMVVWRSSFLTQTQQGPCASQSLSANFRTWHCWPRRTQPQNRIVKSIQTYPFMLCWTTDCLLIRLGMIGLFTECG